MRESPPDLASGQPNPIGPSQFMAGSVAVRLILPESNGQRDPSTANWTPAQIETATRQVQDALDWWRTHLPLARLTFSLDVQIVPTIFEPVNYGLRDEGLWINDVLGNMGYTNGSYFDRAYAAAADLRRQRGSDWATTIFIVNSASTSNGRFADRRFAYAYVNGPFMVLTSDGGAYGATRLAPIVAHEIGHIFGALDQYSAAQIPCDRRSGYLNAPTYNSQIGGCQTSLPSIMLDPLTAYPIGAIDPSALAQIGYRDSNGNGIIDPLDTTPTTRIAATTAHVGQRPVLRGRSIDVGYPSPTHPSVSLNTITRVEYRVAGGDWQPATPDDGAFDSADEAFSFEPALYDGLHQVDVRTINSIGAVSPLTSFTVTVSGVGAQPAYRVSAQDLTNTLVITLSLEAPPTTQAVRIDTNPDCNVGTWQPFSNILVYRLAEIDGIQTFYVCFRDEAGLSSLAYRQHIMLDTQPPTGKVLITPGHTPNLQLWATDNGSGVAAVELQIAGSSGEWQPYHPGATLPVSTTQVAARFRDAAGNVSSLIWPTFQGVVFQALVVR